MDRSRWEAATLGETYESVECPPEAYDGATPARGAPSSRGYHRFEVWPPNPMWSGVGRTAGRDDRRIAVASSGSTFSKMQREREKKERAAAKREKRQDRSAAPEATEATTIVAGESELSAGELVRLVEAIHKEYDDGKIDLDEFEEKKQALLARVRID